jgi:hypothetical protein
MFTQNYVAVLSHHCRKFRCKGNRLKKIIFGECFLTALLVALLVFVLFALFLGGVESVVKEKYCLGRRRCFSDTVLF